MKKPREKPAEVLVDTKSNIGLTIGNVRELGSQGKPENLKELQERISGFFNFCEARNMRPGTAMLATALGVSRQTLWNWCNGSGCSPEWAGECIRARQIVNSVIEALTLSGHLSPPVGIFLLKNSGLGFSDDPEQPQREEIQRPPALTAAELPRLESKNV